MGLVFHDGRMACFHNYTHDLAWNDPALIGNAAVFAQHNNEASIRRILLKTGSTEKFDYKGNQLKFADLIQAADTNGYVLKGLHQPGQGGLIALPHISFAYGGFIYHLDVFDDQKIGLRIFHVHHGPLYDDPEGFIVQKKKGGRRL